MVSFDFRMDECIRILTMFLYFSLIDGCFDEVVWWSLFDACKKVYFRMEILFDEIVSIWVWNI